jgi:hypothetical protein
MRFTEWDGAGLAAVDPPSSFSSGRPMHKDIAILVGPQLAGEEIVMGAASSRGIVGCAHFRMASELRRKIAPRCTTILGTS